MPPSVRNLLQKVNPLSGFSNATIVEYLKQSNQSFASAADLTNRRAAKGLIFAFSIILIVVAAVNIANSERLKNSSDPEDMDAFNADFENAQFFFLALGIAGIIAGIVVATKWVSPDEKLRKTAVKGLRRIKSEIKLSKQKERLERPQTKELFRKVRIAPFEQDIVTITEDLRNLQAVEKDLARLSRSTGIPEKDLITKAADLAEELRIREMEG